MLLHILDRRPPQEKLQRLIEHGIVEREKMPEVMKNIKNRSKSSGSGSSSGIDEEIRSLTFSYIIKKKEVITDP